MQVCFLSDGLRILGLLTKPAGRGPFPAYIHNHGSLTPKRASGPLWRSAEELDRRLASAGFVVLRPARRGYLGSQGTSTTYWVERSSRTAADVIRGAYEEARDVQAAFEWLRAQPFVDPNRIAIGGHSVGGLVSVIAASKCAGVAAVVSVNGGITWVRDGVQEGYPAVRAVWREEADRLRGPVLLLYGTRDEVVPPWLGAELAELLQQRSCPVALRLYDGPHLVFPVEEIVRFLSENVRPTSSARP